jgi:hypothetical protein
LISGDIDFPEIDEAVVGPNVIDVIDMLWPPSEGDQPSKAMEAVIPAIDRDAEISIGIRRSSGFTGKPGIPDFPAATRRCAIEGE